MKRFLVALTLCCVLGGAVRAQDFSVAASIDSSFLFIGEQAGLTFEVEQPQGERIQLPLFSDSIVSGIELVERVTPDTTLLEGGRMRVQHKFVITSFDTALYYIPPFAIYNDRGDTLESNPLSLKVFTVDVDAEQYQVADIKPIYEPPFDWKGFFLIVLYVVLALLVAFGIYWLVRRYVQKKPVFAAEKPEHERPAHEVALEMLDAIRDEKRWERGEAKPYYTELTDVLRIYIVKRYGVNAMESTSDEILMMLRAFDIKRETLLSLKTLFELSDLVKFAKWQPMLDDYLKSLTAAYAFVNDTKEVVATPETEDENAEIEK